MILTGDCLDILPTLDADSIDAIVTDPPYGLSFMGRDWDHGVPGERFWSLMLRVAKPGAHLLAFGGTRTYHRLACAIEDAGWEVRDCLVWAYASGFPKSLDVSKAMDKAAGATREVVGEKAVTNVSRGGLGQGSLVSGTVEAGVIPVTAPATPDAVKWQGWGTALKPAWEPIILARKPLRGTVAANVAEYGTGALNIDATRVGATFPDASRSNGGDSRSGSVPLHEDAQPDRNPSRVLRAWSAARPEADSAPLANALADAFDHRGGLGSPVDCPSCPRCDGGRARIVEAVAQASAPSRRDALAALLSPAGAASRIRLSRCDDHPSTWDELARVVEGAGILPCGNDTTSNVQRGRWPANLILTDPLFDGDVEGVVGGGNTGIERGSTRGAGGQHGRYGPLNATGEVVGYGDSGTYSRFFLIPKASRSDREPKGGGLPERERGGSAWYRACRTCGDRFVDPSTGMPACGHDDREWVTGRPRANTHPTVKPTALMRHLVRLVTPPGGVVLDPFLGSGTTAVACEEEGFDCIGIEREAEYVRIAEARLSSLVPTTIPMPLDFTGGF